jgi:hypothetical protein
MGFNGQLHAPADLPPGISICPKPCSLEEEVYNVTPLRNINNWIEILF